MNSHFFYQSIDNNEAWTCAKIEYTPNVVLHIWPRRIDITPHRSLGEIRFRTLEKILVVLFSRSGYEMFAIILCFGLSSKLDQVGPILFVLHPQRIKIQ